MVVTLEMIESKSKSSRVYSVYFIVLLLLLLLLMMMMILLLIRAINHSSGDNNADKEMVCDFPKKLSWAQVSLHLIM